MNLVWRSESRAKPLVNHTHTKPFISHTPKPLFSHRGQAVVATPSIPALGRQRLMVVCEFTATLGYMRVNMSKREIALTPLISPPERNIRQEHRAVWYFGGEHCNLKSCWGEDWPALVLALLKPKNSLVAWLPCFSYLQL